MKSSEENNSSAKFPANAALVCCGETDRLDYTFSKPPSQAPVFPSPERLHLYVGIEVLLSPV